MSGPRSSAETGVGNAPGDEVIIDQPRRGDGAALWRIARDSNKLDLNSSYAYLLWCEDFADTSAVARAGGDVVGFVMGYRQQRAPDTAVVWQIGVDEAARGMGLASRLLDGLYTRLVADGVHYMETTITPDNAASIALFSSFAARWHAEMARRELFAAADFPDGHEPEDLYRIGPLSLPSN